MKLCNDHWHKLKAAIDTRGLNAFVAKDGQAAADVMKAQIDKGEITKAGFDPLLNANFAIFNNALGVVGLVLMVSNDDGSERCPLCYLASVCPTCQPCQHFEKWIDAAADEQLEEAKRLGLVASS